MADRVLRWHIKGVLSEKGVKDTDVQGQAHRLDRDYRPTDTWLRVKQESQGTEGTGVTIDINDDGVSIFAENPTLPYNTLSETCRAFSGGVMVKGSIITLDVDKVGTLYAGKDLVVELYLNNA